MNKKATEINQQVVITLLSVILAILLLIFAIRACSLLGEKQRQLILSDLEAEINGIVELLSAKYGDVRQHSFQLPEDIDLICFVDTNKSDIIMEKTDLVNEFPYINNSLATGAKENMFLIAKDKVVESMQAGDICFDYFPFYSCIATPSGILDVWFEGRAGCTTLYIDWSIFPDNYRNFSMYNGSPLFITKESRDVDGMVSNQESILPVVPLTLFKEDEIVYPYNYTVTYNDGASLNPGEVQHLLDNVYHTKKAYIFDTPVPAGLDSSYEVSRLNTYDPEDYLSFWKEYNSFIFVDKDNTDAALIASLLSGYVNTPLVFIDEANLWKYKPLIDNRHIFVVTHSTITLDDDVLNYIYANAKRYQFYSDSLLITEGSVIKFSKLNSNITITN
jgi:hypothetical protein